MNLACLLMTIVCLATILLFSSLDRNDAPILSPKHQHNRRNGHQLANSDTSRLSPTPNHLSESIDSLDKQPLERPQQQAKSDELAGSSSSSSSLNGDPDDDDDLPASSSSSESIAKLDGGDNTTDGFSLFDDRQPALASDDTPTIKSPGQREVEEQTQAPSKDAYGMRRAPTSLIDPILSQVFEDLDGFNPFRALRENAKVNYTSMKPIVKQTKDGTTIIISSGGFSSAFNGSSNATNATNISSLIEKLLPPMFRPLSLLSSMQRISSEGKPVGLGNNGGIATITINSEPIMAGSSSSSSPPVSPFFGPRLAEAELPFAAGFPFARILPPQRPLFMTTSMSSPGMFPAGPPGGLLSMIMRATEMANEQASEQANSQDKKAKSNSSDPLISPQASQLNNQTVSLNGTSTATNSTANKIDTDDEVETFDVNQGPRAVHHLPSLFGPKRMMGSGGGGGEPMASSGPGMSPILRAILGNVMSDLSAASGDDKNRPRLASASRRSMWAPPSIEEDSDSWDEREPKMGGGRFVRIRHRSFDDQPLTGDDRSPSEDGPDSSDSRSLVDQLLDQPPMGAFSGSIRQTFRGPDVTVERVIEMPSNGDNRPSLNPLEGVRSQSISRMDEPTAESLPRPMFAAAALAGQPQPPSASVMSHGHQRFVRFMQDLAPSPPVGLIDRLLGDLTAAGGRLMGHHQIKSRQDMIEEDLDEGDSSAPEESVGLANKWSPKISVATARVRMLHPSTRRSDPPSGIFMPPRFTFSASGPSNLDELGHLANNKLASSLEEALEASIANGNGNSNGQPQQQVKQQSSPIANEHSSPFTSPSSPLFGFPAMPTAPQNNQPPQASNEKKITNVRQTQQEQQDNNDGHVSHRQPRAFVYHSNHELAGGHSTQIKSRSSGEHDDQQQQQQQVAPAVGLIGRPRSFMPAQRVSGLAPPPPASIIMGRRLDDGPFASVDSNRQHQDGSMLD